MGGNPSTDEICAKYMSMYDPYQNLSPISTNTPHMHITTAVNDPRVPFWGPTKYTARLRQSADTSNLNGGISRLVLLNADFNAGHFSPTGPNTADISPFANEYS